MMLPLRTRIIVRRLTVPAHLQPKPLPEASRQPLADAIRKLTPDQIQLLTREPQILSWSWSKVEPSVGTLDFDSNVVTEALRGASNFATFDLWDTLIGRTRPAESVKRATALKISLAHWRLGDFKEPLLSSRNIHEIRNELESSLSGQSEPQAESVMAALVSQLDLKLDPLSLCEGELTDELRNTRVLKDLVDLIQSTASRPDIISDHQMSAASIEKILVEHGIRELFGRVFVSSEVKSTKRHGGAIFRDLGLDSKEGWHHFGDNEWSDVKCVEAQNGSGHLVTRTRQTAWNAHEISEFELGRQLRNHLSGHGAEALLIDVAAVSFALVTSAIEVAVKEGKRKILYVSREGETLSRAHEFLFASFGSLLPEVHGVHLEASRASVFGASFRGNVEEALALISKQYPLMSGKTFSATFSLPLELEEKVYKVVGPFENLRSHSFASRLGPELTSQISSYLEEQGKLLEMKLSNLKIDMSDVVICDLGWRGTIQDALNRISGESAPGVYFGCFAPFTPNVNGSSKKGLLFDADAGKQPPAFLAFLGPLERAFTLSGRSASRYQEDSGIIKVEMQASPDAPSIERLELFESGFEEVFREVAGTLFDVGLFGFETDEFVRGVTHRWYEDPTAFHASTWFDEVHAEGFGVTDEVHYSRAGLRPEWFEKGGSTLAVKAMRDSLWPQGFCAWKPVASIFACAESN